MEFLKKEWRTLVFALWLVVITAFLIVINGQLAEIQHTGAKVASTLDSVESVSLSTDAGVHGMSQKVDGIDSNVQFIVSKVRRR